MTRYQKGAGAERELIHIFSEKGYSVIRAAGSGVSQTSPPDIIVMKKGRQFALECKAWNSGRIAIPHDKYQALKRWEENTGITTMMAWKIPYKGWKFVYLQQLEENPRSFSITLTKAEAMGKSIEEMLQ
jgi:Holliday junction resolvase